MNIQNVVNLKSLQKLDLSDNDILEIPSDVKKTNFELIKD